MAIAVIDPYQQWQAAARLYKAKGVETWDGEQDFSTWGAGVVVRPHRLFVVGDLVLVHFNNGEAHRYPCWGQSSKGRSVVRYYLSCHKTAHVRVRWTPDWRVAQDLDPAEPTCWAHIGPALRAELWSQAG